MATKPETAFRPVRPPVEPPTALLLAFRPSLPAAEAGVADALLSDAAATRYESVGELAERSGSSPATVVRLCKRLGFDGFLAMKIALAEEAGAARQFGHPELSAQGGAGEALEHSMLADAQSLRGAMPLIDRGAFEQAVDAIAGCERLLLGGVGTSAALAELAAIRFLALGLHVTLYKDVLAQHLAAQLLAPGGVCLLISHTGSSTDTVEFAKAARKTGATTVGVTSFARSPLARAVMVPLVTANKKDRASLELFTNRIVHVSLLGALHAAVAATLPTSEASKPSAVIAKHQY
jgi:DNA-binding MurR/RpiR family transcriptional regulator